MYVKVGGDKFDDVSSSANADECAINHIHLDWNVDFEQERINGRCRLDVEALQATDRVVSYFYRFEFRQANFHSFRISTFAISSCRVFKSTIAKSNIRLPTRDRSVSSYFCLFLLKLFSRLQVNRFRFVSIRR